MIQYWSQLPESCHFQSFQSLCGNAIFLHDNLHDISRWKNMISMWQLHASGFMNALWPFSSCFFPPPFSSIWAGGGESLLDFLPIFSSSLSLFFFFFLSSTCISHWGNKPWNRLDDIFFSFLLLPSISHKSDFLMAVSQEGEGLEKKMKNINFLTTSPWDWVGGL